ncbi:MrcB family domain-containing protein [Myroides odoratimimus]|uniref:MrcB family domain-containing protein n=1 Tax=Myroides odoratimimus TaxID=76832 RepID=UPI0031011857
MNKIFQDILSKYLTESQKVLTNNVLANKIRNEYADTIRDFVNKDNKDMVVTGSCGQGRWATIPWIGIFDTRITKSAQEGFYPVYLFCEDMSGFYLSLNQGVTKLKDDEGLIYAREFLANKSIEFQKTITLANGFKADRIDLHITNPKIDAALYEQGNIVSKFYDTKNLPSAKTLEDDLSYLLNVYNDLVSKYNVQYTSIEEYNADYINQNKQAKELEELEQIKNNKELSVTEKDRLVKSRLGQGFFRSELIKLNKQCAISGCINTNLLIASHIKPWRVCNNKERIDPYNGLLLLPTFDKLFDQGFISFNNNGEIIISDQILGYHELLGLTTKVKISVNQNQHKYLDYHRKNVLKKKK